VTLFLNYELVSRVTLYLVSFFPRYCQRLS